MQIMRAFHLSIVILAFLFPFGFSIAQCIPAIKSNSLVISSDTTINGGFAPAWVCPFDTFHSDGGFHNVYLEPGAVMTTGVGIDSIYVKKGAKLIMNGGIHEIFFADTLDLMIAGGIPYYHNCPSGTDTFCQGQFATLSAIVTGASGASSYQWSNNDTTMTTTDSLPGYRTVTVIDSMGCVAMDSILLIQKPNPTVSASGFADICPGDTVQLLSIATGDSSSPFYTYNWTPSVGLDSSGSDNPLAFPLVSTTYYVTASSVWGCTSSPDSVLISVLPDPGNAEITLSGDTIMADTTAPIFTYQWYRDDSLIPGANQPFYVFDSSGCYKVIVACGICISESDTICLTILQAQNKVMTGIRIFPNPFSEGFKVLPGDFQESGNIWIRDLAGKILYRMEFEDSQTLEIGRGDLPAGILIVEVESGRSGKFSTLMIAR